MKTIIELIDKLQKNDELNLCIFSSPRQKSSLIKSIHIHKTTDNKNYKLENRYEKHNDINSVSSKDLLCEVEKYLSTYKQCLIRQKGLEHQILLNKKLDAHIKTRKLDLPKPTKGKNYLIPEGQFCDFLFEVGIMNKSGVVKPKFYKKFKQINRFIELVDHLFKDQELPKNKTFKIVDFGCGKSYLTFALYHYFKKIRDSKVEITGIDLKKEVVANCNAIAKKLNFDQLNFKHGLINSFEAEKNIDFVVSLHACDTATDDAILFSLKNKVDKMMFVPCCQHELNQQLENSKSQSILKHGILKDQMTAIVTDSMRSQLLEACGYHSKIIEFIDLEHTAKNLMIRCEKANNTKPDAYSKYLEFRKEWGIKPYLENELKKLGFLKFDTTSS